jgi:hypothetical protein
MENTFTFIAKVLFTVYICVMPISTSGKELVKKSGLKSRFLAAYADIGEAQFSNILAGKREPTLDQARALCEVLSKALKREIKLEMLFPYTPKNLPVPKL